ncbi:MAG: ATP-binding protein, partial [Desulfosporosinus sp.]
MPSFETDTNHELLPVLDALILHWEKEIVEFKEAKSQFDTDRLGRYFSAISNEANLKNQQFGWMIFGVRENDRQIIGTNYKDTTLEKLKHEIALSTTDGISFLDIFEVYPVVDGQEKRVVMFKIPAAITAMPTGWKNRYYGRDGDSLTPLTQRKIDIIRGQQRKDWSKQLITSSSLTNLDPEAIQIAKEKYKGKKKKEHISLEVDAMSDEAFLTKLRLMDSGLLTNAAMILLGNPDYKHLIDRPPTVMWRLFSGAGDNRDYEIFELPFITVGDRVYAKLRNLTYRYMPNQRTLFPVETMQYDQSMIYELLNNCMAHQEYSMGARIYVDEYEDKIKFTNPGDFMPGDIRAVLDPSYAPPFYKNQLLAETMANFGMIDTATMGIRKVFEILRRKYFPMPDYETDHN